MSFSNSAGSEFQGSGHETNALGSSENPATSKQKGSFNWDHMVLSHMGPRPPVLAPLMALPLAGSAPFLPGLALASPLPFLLCLHVLCPLPCSHALCPLRACMSHALPAPTCPTPPLMPACSMPPPTLMCPMPPAPTSTFSPIPPPHTYMPPLRALSFGPGPPIT